jgi:hypothetical protein
MNLFGPKNMNSSENPDTPDSPPPDELKLGKLKPFEFQEKDENGLVAALWPYRDEMKEWTKKYKKDFDIFVEYKNAKFDLICGTGFYHQPSQDKISLSVPYYKDCVESGKMTIDQILFASFHELAHLKTMYELDRAGKYNQLAQFDYENKVIPDKYDPQKFVSLQPAYRHFYNILEDAIVNHLALNTKYFGKSFDQDSKRRSQEVVDLYTDKFFKVTTGGKEQGGGYDYTPFISANPGEGTHMENPNKKETDRPFIRVAKGRGTHKENEEPIVFAGEGQGEYRFETKGKADFEKGFKWKEAFPPMNRSGQFMTYFIKNQMIGTDSRNVFHETLNPEGKHVMDEDVSAVYNMPLPDAYNYLLERVIKKYKDEPAQLEKYLNFMSMVSKVPTYTEKKGKIVEGEPELVDNVFNPACLLKGQRSINFSLANLYYKDKLKRACDTIGIKNFSSVKFIDLFNHYKDKKRSAGHSWTLPLKKSLDQRTRITRNIIEPIFTLLCILDDTFDASMPPEQEQGTSGRSSESNEKPEWRRGDKVVRVDASGQPVKNEDGTLKKGIVYNVTYGPDKEIKSVTVKYFKDKKQTSAMAGGPSYDLTVEVEEVYNPYQNLKLLSDRSKESQAGQGPNDPRQRYYENDDEPEEDDKKNENKDRDQGEPEENKINDPDEEPGGDDKKNGKEIINLDKVLDDQAKYLKQLIENDERAENIKELEEAESDRQHQADLRNEEKVEELLRMLYNERLKNPQKGDVGADFSADEAIVRKYLELKKVLKPFADKMADEWIKVVDNITSRIEAVKEKYYRTGTMDIKKMNRHFPEIEYGQDMEFKLIYEQIIEKKIIDILPRMLRVIFSIDNSGSIESYGFKEPIQMVIMLLHISLADFRLIFEEKMRTILGPSRQGNISMLVDTQLWTFGSQVNKIKDFKIKDLSFLEDTNIQQPETDKNQEIIDTLIAFRHFTADEGATKDAKFWKEIGIEHQDPMIQKALKERWMTEAIFQITDAGIQDTKEAQEYIDVIRKYKLGVAGLAMGSDDAVKSLEERLGPGNAEKANTPAEIAEKFGVLLKRIIIDKIEKPMMQYLDQVHDPDKDGY